MKPIKLIECPRDAMQGWTKPIPTATKTAYLNTLLKVGFDTLDFGSFVSPKAIPQMADTAEVLKGIDLSGTSTSLLAIVANTRGAEEALTHPEIAYLGFPFSISPTFQQRNTNSTMEESLQRVEEIQERCLQKGRTLVVYLSMGFGNPYGDPYDAETLLKWAEEMSTRGITILSLADTVGMATPEQIRFALETLVPRHPGVEIGVHLHATSYNWEEKLAAALSAGCTRIDGALRGIGGCPMAQDELVGNIDTEKVIRHLEASAPSLQLNKDALAQSLRLADVVFS
jgi:hydroxymethylglutaryl-CoA lyase